MCRETGLDVRMFMDPRLVGIEYVGQYVEVGDIDDLTTHRIDVEPPGVEHRGQADDAHLDENSCSTR